MNSIGIYIYIYIPIMNYHYITLYEGNVEMLV